MIFTGATAGLGPLRENPLQLSGQLRQALRRASREQLAYEIPVDLNTCTEEEKEFWTIKRANIRNGGRVRENPLHVDKKTDPARCQKDDGSWTKFIPERLEGEEKAAFDQLNTLCDSHIVTDHLS